ncbi:branched-chain amino acid ABC transporter ATP-binding protein/permease [Nocardioides pelophilus]|uniref:branched-chain amino acid ABC transporter ATP-binding protein/permease n=1 Tax=Nocardioides pelophilus TaxID=2172019 RepID=UPI00160337C5|nr:branched-chain amino acid ABC transporter ATP-binding protein/permease [Nocardioides pelophilus]
MDFWYAYICMGLIYAVMAIALNLIVGYAGINSVGSAAFAAIGGYTTALVGIHQQWPLLPTVIASVVVGTVVAVALSAPILGLAQEYVMLITMAMSILVSDIASSTTSLGGQTGLIGLPAPQLLGKVLLVPADFLPLLIGVLVLASFIAWRLGESPFGRLMRATRDDDLGVRSLGKSTLGRKVLVFGISCALTSAAGALLVLYNGLATPTLFSLDQTLLVFAMVVIGGISSVPGSIVGAFIVVFLEPVLQQTLAMSPEDSAGIRPIVFGVALVLIVRFRPAGIIPERHHVPRVRKAVTEAPVAQPGALTVLEAKPAINPAEPETAPVVVEIRGLAKRFGGVVAVNGLDLKLREGLVTALVGANGAGKSTVFNLITGAIAPDEGTVLLNGDDITRLSPQQVARRGMVRSFQDLRVFNELTPMENVMLAGRHHPGESAAGVFLRPLASRRHDRELAEKSAEWLEFVGLDPAHKARARDMSFAQQKQVAFARVLATEASVFLLDEPLSGIEGRAADDMLTLVERVRETGRTICVVEHSIQAISRLSDWAYFMEGGSVSAEGSIHDLLADPRLGEAYFGAVS